MAPKRNAPSKDALAEGQAVGNYLRALETRQPTSGDGARRYTPETVRVWLNKARAQLDKQSGTKKLLTFNRIRELEQILGENGVDDKFVELETKFVENAKSFADRHNVVYSAWRDFGVSPEVLKRAGIARGSATI